MGKNVSPHLCCQWSWHVAKISDNKLICLEYSISLVRIKAQSVGRCEHDICNLKHISCILGESDDQVQGNAQKDHTANSNGINDRGQLIGVLMSH